MKPEAAFGRPFLHWQSRLKQSLAAFAFMLAVVNPAQAEITLGVAGPLSGQFGILGTQMKNGVDAAVKAINAGGGINGEPLVTLPIDDACDTRRAVEAAKEFVARGAVAVVGHFCSGASLAAALIYKDAAIPMLTPSATAPQLTEARHWNVFRLAQRDDAFATLTASRIKAFASAQNPVFVGDGQANAEMMLAAIRPQLPALKAFEFKPGSAAQTRLRANLEASNPQAIVLGLPGAEAARVMAMLTDMNFNGRVYGGESLLSEDFTNRTGALGFDVLAMLPADPVQNQLAGPVVAALTLAGQDADGATLPAYAATQVFVAAAKATQVNDGKALAQWLRNGQTVNTILGKLSFDTKGDLASPASAWYVWNGEAKRFLPE